MSTKSLASRLTLKECSWLVVLSLLGFIVLFLFLQSSNKNSLNPSALAQDACSPDYNPADPDLDFSFSIDKEEYAVGETVFMISEGNECGVELMLTITRPDGIQDTNYIVTNDHGNFSYDYVIGDIEGEYAAEVRSADGVTLLGSDKFHSSSATVTTDKSDYSPGENVIITGSGWQPGETVELEIVEEPLIHDPDKLNATTDEFRNIFNDEYIIQDHDVGQAFTLLATGISSGLTAFTNFTDHLQLFFSSFGNANNDNVGVVDSWVESGDDDGNDCRITDGSSRSGSATAQHARLCGCAITRNVSTAGHNSIQLRYYCRGDEHAESTQRLNVFADSNGDGVFTDPGERVASHTIDGEESSCPDDGWSSQKVINLPAANDNANFKIRFVSTTSDCTGSDIEEPRVDDVEVTGVDIPVCGDSIVGTGESCDDGNTTGGDGCSATCTTETGYFCLGEPSDCCHIVSNFKECFDLGSGDTNCSDDSSDSNTVDSNNAPAWTENEDEDDDCRINNEELRLRNDCTVTQSSINTAGYSNIRLLYLWGEEIDEEDGTLVVEWKPTSSGSWTSINNHPLTGDTGTGSGFAVNPEDEPLGPSANNTSIDFRFAGDTDDDDDRGYVDNVVLCGDAAVCGDGLINGTDECDDGNTANGDGCSSSCVIEDGFDCTGAPSVCTPVCGDGLTKGAETCDDGNTANGDCCSSTCQIDPDTTPCLDGNACNGAEACQAGVCTSGEPLTCDNGLFCDGTETCDPSSGCQDGPDPSTDDGVGCTTDTCDEGTDTITHAPVDAVCSDDLFCTGTETCNVTLGCQDGPDPSTDDGVGCTTDTCDETEDKIVHTPDDTVCDDDLFCTGTETCDATQGCQDGTPPETDDGFGCTNDSCDEDADKVVHDPNDDFCSDDLLCTADVCEPDAEGADETSGCTNQFDEEVCFASVTSSSLCNFDVDKDTDGCQFRLIFTPDQNSPSAWKQNASNPGQYYYNTFYVGAGDETVNITVPYPFVTQGAVPIHIYDSVGGVPSGDTGCYLPGTEIGNSSSLVKLIDYTDTNMDGKVGFGDTYTVQVPVPTVEDGYAYINIHLDYGLKGTNNYSKNALNDAIDATSFAIRIPNLYGYDFDDDSLTAGDTCQNTNVFKRDPGIGGLVLESDGDPVANVKVQIYQGTKLMTTVYTDADGWYMWQYKYTGKAATFTVKLPDYNLSKSVTLKSNGYLVLSFTLP